jgi:hypothetical protein
MNKIEFCFNFYRYSLPIAEVLPMSVSNITSIIANPDNNNGLFKGTFTIPIISTWQCDVSGFLANC